MNVKFSLVLAAVMTAGAPSLAHPGAAIAQTFSEESLDQTRVIAIARPYGGNKYDLLVLEQIPGKQQCWTESGASPVTIDPLLLNFDFTGICRRATDSNGYSIRLDGRDLGLHYILRVLDRGNELVLVATPRDSRKTELIVGRTRGKQAGFLKILLDPGWKFSRRFYQGKSLGHYYFSGNEAEILAAAGKTPPVEPTPSIPSGTSFKDTGDDIYRAEIEKAVALGFVAGFKEDNTFRPDVPVTREQFVSMIIGGLGTVTKVNLDEVSAGGTTFTDVEATRWSAKRIQWARAQGIVAGKAGGEFRPTDPVTRAEMMAILRQAAIWVNTRQKLPPSLQETRTVVAFSDISGHWAAGTIEQMSGFCGVASPLDEKGTAFAPNEPAHRNYAAAAIVRTLDCLKAQKK